MNGAGASPSCCRPSCWLISLWIRLKLNESPAFQRMAAEGTEQRAPFREAFLTWRNGRFVLLALFGIMIAQGAVWYAGYFYTRFFMERVLKVEVATVDPWCWP